MSNWSWRGRNAAGELIQGVIDADDDAAVADQLLASGVTPVSITGKGRAAGAPAGAAGWWETLRAAPVSEHDFVVFARDVTARVLEARRIVDHEARGFVGTAGGGLGEPGGRG